MELNFKNCFKYYDDELLKCLNFEIMIIFNDLSGSVDDYWDGDKNE